MSNPEEHFARIRREELAKQRADLEKLTDGRHVVIKFKAGGRIKEEHVYDSESALETPETGGTFLGLLFMFGHQEDGSISVGPHMIGQGFMGYDPWDMPGTDGKRRSLSEEDKFNMSCPLRVADVIERPGSVTIEVEASA